MLTPLIANDHVDGGFTRLVNRIVMMLEHMELIDVAEKLYGEGYDPIDIKLASAAARLLRIDMIPDK